MGLEQRRRSTDRQPEDEFRFFVGLKNALMPSLAIWLAIALVLFAIFGELLL